MKSLTTTSLLILALVLAPAALAQEEHEGGMMERHHGVEFLNPEGANPNRPFSEAVRVGNTLYLAGAIGTIPGRGLAPGGIQGETRAAMEIIKARVEKYGSDMDHVVKCTVMLADIGEWGAMNEVYVTFFPNNKPARSAFGSSGLAIDARVEIECIAVIPE